MSNFIDLDITSDPSSSGRTNNKGTERNGKEQGMREKGTYRRKRTIVEIQYVR